MISDIRFATRRLALAAAVCLLVTPSFADTYPSHPIRLVHGFAPGGAADTLSRIVAEGLSRNLGQPVVVEAKPGAGGNIAADAVALEDGDLGHQPWFARPTMTDRSTRRFE